MLSIPAMETASRPLLGKGRANLISTLLALFFVSLCLGAATDAIRDADQQQSGYSDNHNMDPNIIQGATFGAFLYQAVVYLTPG